MASPSFLDLKPRECGLSDPLSEDIELLDRLLGRVLEEQGGREMIETARRLYRDGRIDEHTDVWEAYPELRDPQRLGQVLRGYTVLFQLLNLAEQKEIVRVNRQRQAEAHRAPRRESILDTILQMKEQGVDAGTMQELLHRLDICPTLTAHPTEARRRAVLDKLDMIAGLLAEHGYPDTLVRLDQPLNRKVRLEGEMIRALNALWLTEELSWQPVTVDDEIHNAVYFLEHTIFDVVTWLHRDVREALAQAYPGVEFTLPPFLRYRSWVGGDRDGNPKVTPEVTWNALVYQRKKVLILYIRRVTRLLRELTHSARLLPADRPLRDSLERDRETVPVPDHLLKRYQDEPYAAKMLYIRTRLMATLRHVKSLKNPGTLGEAAQPPAAAYQNAAEFLQDLELVLGNLRQSRAHVLAGGGPLADLIVQAQTFGFHLAALDIRQHSDEHERLLDDIFAAAHLIPDGSLYSGLTEFEKIRLLTQEMFNPRPLLSPEWPRPERVRLGLGIFEVMREAGRLFSPEVVPSYIISMTHSISDVLEVLVLAKEAGLVRFRQQGPVVMLESDLDIVPLFETIDDLAQSGRLMQELFANEAYAMQLNARKRFQEIMLGYSDSSKDGGYMAANWNLQDTQDRLARVCQDHGVDWRLFHGRGGTVGRGGGRAYLAIRAQAPGSLNGRIRFTEQGEVISFRYSFAPIAHRHLEQIVGAVLFSSLSRYEVNETATQWRESMARMAEYSRRTYRALVYDDPEFWPFYIQSTPIASISHLPIASRPVSRQGDRMVGMEDLRAIPWVFSWVQNRYLITGWYGMGSALEWFAGLAPDHLERMREMYRQWPFFALILNNAQLELIRAHLPTAAWYAARVQPPELGERIHAQIQAEFERTREWILKITGQEELLSHAEAVRRTVSLRNPVVMPLNRLQVALLGRPERPGGNPDKPRETEPAFREALLLSIAGIAAAMQSTG
ncbi:MAG TPA: phosphoenolpyruvate carboxylase [bacterium]|nr:phosphoenolpyruvate carboxylase [bacterium]